MAAAKSCAGGLISRQKDRALRDRQSSFECERGKFLDEFTSRPQSTPTRVAINLKGARGGFAAAVKQARAVVYFFSSHATCTSSIGNLRWRPKSWRCCGCMNMHRTYIGRGRRGAVVIMKVPGLHYACISALLTSLLSILLPRLSWPQSLLFFLVSKPTAQV